MTLAARWRPTIPIGARQDARRLRPEIGTLRSRGPSPTRLANDVLERGLQNALALLGTAEQDS